MQKIHALFFAFTLVLSTLISVETCLAQPEFVSYQGQLLKDGVPFTGSAQFKFVLYDADIPESVWSNDDTSVDGSQPTSFVTLSVDQGIFSVLLGGTGMVALTANDVNQTSILELRIWVNTGGGFEQLPDQLLASSIWSHHSESADRAPGPFTANGLIHSTVGGFRFPDGSVQVSAATGAGGGTLDQAYDFGGPGAGRTITADAGAVNIAGPNGLSVTGNVGIGTATPNGHLAVENAGANDNTILFNMSENENPEFYFESGFSGNGDTSNFLKMRTAWLNTPMTWRGDGKVAIKTSNVIGALTVEHSGVSVLDPTVFLRNTNAGASVAIYAETSGTDGTIVLNNAGSGDIVRGFNGGGSPVFRVDHSGKAIAAGLQVTAGPLIVDSSSRIRMTGAFGGGVGGAPIYSENTTSNGIALWGKVTGTDATQVLEQNGTGSLIKAFKSGSVKFEVTNTGRVVTTALQITGGGDLAEPFNVAEGDGIEPGAVLVIDESHAGRLKLSAEAYDRRVAGVLSGAGGIEPGITLTPSSHQIGGRHVALSGRVYAKAVASNGPIRPGDLLTTSGVPGHVMKASDQARTPGAVIGKAMTALDAGRGLVLVLVSLQ